MSMSTPSSSSKRSASSYSPSTSISGSSGSKRPKLYGQTDALDATIIEDADDDDAANQAILPESKPGFIRTIKEDALTVWLVKKYGDSVITKLEAACDSWEESEDPATYKRFERTFGEYSELVEIDREVLRSVHKYSKIVIIQGLARKTNKSLLECDSKTSRVARLIRDTLLGNDPNLLVLGLDVLEVPPPHFLPRGHCELVSPHQKVAKLLFRMNEARLAVFVGCEKPINVLTLGAVALNLFTDEEKITPGGIFDSKLEGVKKVGAWMHPGRYNMSKAVIQSLADKLVKKIVTAKAAKVKSGSDDQANLTTWLEAVKLDQASMGRSEKPIDTEEERVMLHLNLGTLHRASVTQSLAETTGLSQAVWEFTEVLHKREVVIHSDNVLKLWWERPASLGGGQHVLSLLLNINIRKEGQRRFIEFNADGIDITDKDGNVIRPVRSEKPAIPHSAMPGFRDWRLLEQLWKHELTILGISIPTPTAITSSQAYPASWYGPLVGDLSRGGPALKPGKPPASYTATRPRGHPLFLLETFLDEFYPNGGTNIVSSLGELPPPEHVNHPGYMKWKAAEEETQQFGSIFFRNIALFRDATDRITLMEPRGTAKGNRKNWNYKVRLGAKGEILDGWKSPSLAVQNLACQLKPVLSSIERCFSSLKIHCNAQNAESSRIGCAGRMPNSFLAPVPGQVGVAVAQPSSPAAQHRLTERLPMVLKRQSVQVSQRPL